MKLTIWQLYAPQRQWQPQGRDDPAFPLVLPVEVVAPSVDAAIPALAGSASGTHEALITSGTGAGTIPTLAGDGAGLFSARVQVGSQRLDVITTEAPQIRIASQRLDVITTEAQSLLIGSQRVDVIGTVAEVLTKFRNGDLGTGITVDTAGVCVTSSTGSVTTAVATNPINTPLVFFTWKIDTHPSGTITVGVGPQNISKSQEVGFNSKSVGLRSNGDLYTNGSASALGLGSYTAGDDVNVCVKPATGEVWFGKNGTFSGDPAAGTGAAATISSTKFYPVVSLGASGQKVCLDATHGGFTGTPPSGSEPLDPYWGLARGTIPTLLGDGTDSLPTVTGTGAATAQSLTGAASGVHGVSGTASRSLTVSGSATGTLGVVGVGVAAAPALVGTASGVRGVTGTGAATVPALQDDGASGVLGNAGVGVGTVSVSASATGGQGVAGAGEAVLPGTAGSAAGSRGVAGSAAGQIGGLIGAGVAFLTVQGTGAAAVPALGGQSVGQEARPSRRRTRKGPVQLREPWLAREVRRQQVEREREDEIEAEAKAAARELVAGAGRGAALVPFGRGTGAAGRKGAGRAATGLLSGRAIATTFDTVGSDNDILLTAL